MRKAETLFIGIGLLAIIAVMGGAIWYHGNSTDTHSNFKYPETKYGNFLAAQHAVYVNDFDAAANFAEKLTDSEYTIVENTRYISEFLGGKMPANAGDLAKEKSAPARIIYDTYLIQNANWDELYNRHKKDESALAAPLRIWSAVAKNRITETLKFIDKLSTNASWKDFVRGQIYAETNKPDQAAEYFAKVAPEFLNINDYLYIMSFYMHNNMADAARTLHDEFTARPGGIFMLGYDKIPEWSVYSGFQNALAFSLVQNVSHTQIMMYSDLSILFLRTAQIAAPDMANNTDAINYYLGQFFYNNSGDYDRYFSQIDRESPFYLFAIVRHADKTGDMAPVRRMMREHPLFVPGVQTLIAYDIQHNNKRDALRVVNRALKHPDLNENARAFFLKNRARIYYAFGDTKRAQTDIHDASVMLPSDLEILSIQAKIWADENREIETAYDYAMALVQRNPTDVAAWDTLGVVVAAREGTDAALELLSRVGEVSVTCSSLFDHMGDLYAASGDTERARDAYLRAIDLSDDGLTVVSKVKKKLRKLK